MNNFMGKISRAGLILAIIGGVLLWFALGDAIISFKPARSFDDVLEDGLKAGDHVSGRVPYLLDYFGSLQTWTENSANNSRTPAKTSARYYVLPAGENYAGLRVGTQNIPAAGNLVDETYGYLAGAGEPTTVLEIDARVVEMEEELVELFRDEMKEYYDYTDQELESMGTLLMVEPRAFTAVRVICGLGLAFLLLGILLLVRRWRKISAAYRQAQAAYDPELG